MTEVSGRQTVLAAFRCRPWLSMVLCSLLWSTGGLLIKMVNWNAFAIAGTRSIISAVVLCLALGRVPRRFSADSVIAAVSYAATMLLFVLANKMTTAAAAILLQYTYPVFVILFSGVLLKERVYWFDYLTVFGVFGGMCLFFGDGLGISINAGNLVALGSGVAFASTTLFMRRQKNAAPEDSFVLAHVITFVASIPFIFMSAPPTALGVAGLVLLGVVQIGIPSILYAAGISGIPAVSAVLITMLEPIMNPIWVALFYREIPSLFTILGGALILFFVVLRVFLRQINQVRT